MAGAAAATTVALAGCGLLSDGPTDIARQYLQALADGDEDTVEELAHEDAEYLSNEAEETELTINSVEESTIEDAADYRDRDEDDLEELVEDETDDIGADDYAIVSFEIEVGGDDEEGFIWLVKDDGWKVYQFL